MEIAITIFGSWNNKSTMWFWLIPLALLTYYFAMKIVRYSTGLMSKTKLKASFIGAVLMSIITSVPELVSQIVQSAEGTPNMAILNDLGANSLTTFAMAATVLFFFRNRIMKQMNNNSKIMSIITLLTTIFLTVALYFAKDLKIGKSGIFLIGIIPIILFLIFVVVSIYSYWHNHDDSEEPSLVYEDDHNVKQIVARFIFFAVLLIITAILLNWAVDSFAVIYSVDQKSSGGLILSFATALPEITSFILFMRIGHPSAAIGMVLGTHIFNLSQIFIGDMLFNKNPVIINQGSENLWSIGLMLSIMLFLLTIFIFSSKKINSRFSYFIFPIGIMSTYLIGWALISTFLG